MMVAVCLCLVIRYLYFKFIFIRFCKVPMLYNEIFNNRVILILKIILILRCLISIYMYGAVDVFAMEKSVFMQWVINMLLIQASSLQIAVVASVFIVFSRILLTWYYSVFVLIFILVLVFKGFIFRMVRKCRNRNLKQIKNQSSMTPMKTTIANNSTLN